MLTKSRYYEPLTMFSRLRSESKMGRRDGKSLYLSPQHSIDPDKQRYKLVPLTRKEGSLSRQQPATEDTLRASKLDRISNDIVRLQEELQYKHSLRKSLERSNIHLKTTQHRIEDQQQGLLPRRKYLYRNEQEETFSPGIWANPDTFQSTARKKIKIYKIKSKKTNRQVTQLSDNLPVIDNIRLLRSRRKSKEYFYEEVKSPTRLKTNFSRHYFHPYRNFRKAVHVVLFTIYLRKFNERMRRNRQGFFDRFVKEQVKEKLLNLKNYLVQNSQPFFLELISQHSFDYSPSQKDDPRLQKQKVASLRKLIELMVGCLQKSVRTIANKEYFSQLLYYLCKHGNYSSSYQMNTLEQVNLSCISELYGYMRGDKYLEQSSILSLFFIKIVLYNILLQPQKIPILVNFSGNKDLIFKNIKIIANILYELMIDIQDDFLEKAPAVYSIGNWKQSKTGIKFAHSMTIKTGLYQKNELISGLSSHQFVKETYGTKYMIQDKNMLEELVRLLHKNIVKVHERIRKKYY